MTHVLIVGAGPAGLMAAIAAAGRGARAVVREQLDRPGAKLLASGGGRCNLTNTADEAAFVAAFGRQGRFILPALRAFGPAALRRFLADRGVPTGAADGFRVLPRSGRAADVLNALLDECGRLGVTVRCGTPVTGLLLSGGLTASAVQVPPAVPTVRVCGVVAGGREIAADAVIVAAGGAGWPELGGTGGGYALARQAGHALVEPSPSLVGLVTVEPWPRSCAGVSLPQARVWIDAPATGRGAGRARGRAAARRGEVLLTHEGVSGPAVLDLSGDVAEMLRRGGPVRRD